MKILLSIILLGLVLTTTQANQALANARCGAGTMLWSGGANSLVSQTFEASTNQLFLNESFSVTTGTSGCKNSGFVNATPDQLFFVHSNYEELIVDMANGKGEMLTAFAQTLGCSKGALQEFGNQSQVHVGDFLTKPGETPDHFLYKVQTMMKSNSILSSGCTKVVI